MGPENGYAEEIAAEQRKAEKARARAAEVGQEQADMERFIEMIVVASAGWSEQPVMEPRKCFQNVARIILQAGPAPEGHPQMFYCEGLFLPAALQKWVHHAWLELEDDGIREVTTPAEEILEYRPHLRLNCVEYLRRAVERKIVPGHGQPMLDCAAIGCTEPHEHYV